MELIAASAIVKAQQRAAAAVPYSDQITEVVKDLAAAGGSTARRCSPAATVGNVAYVVHHRRPRPVRRLQRRRAARRRRRDQGRRAARPRLLGDRRRSQGRELLPVPRLQDQGQVRRVSATPRATPTPKRSASTSSICSSTARSTGSSWIYTRFISAGSQEVVQRPLVPLERDTVAGGDGRPAGDR